MNIKEKIININKEITKVHNEPFGVLNDSVLEFSINEYLINPYNQNKDYLYLKIVFNVIQNHCFLEGNKRTGCVLLINYFNKKNIIKTDEEIIELIIKVSSCEITIEKFINFYFYKYL